MYARKDEIGVVIMKAVAVIISIVKSIIDSIFNNKSLGSVTIGGNSFNLDDKVVKTIAKIAGAITAILAVTRVISIIMYSWNAVYSVIKGIAQGIVDIVAPVIKKVIAQCSSGIGGLIFDFMALTVAIAATVFVLNQVYHAMRQLKGEEEAYHNASIQTWKDAAENLTNADFMLQSIKYGLAMLSRFLIQSILTPLRVILSTITGIIYVGIKPLVFLLGQVAELVANIAEFLGKKDLANQIRGIKKQINDTLDGIGRP